jgi:hypothetical protein
MPFVLTVARRTGRRDVDGSADRPPELEPTAEGEAQGVLADPHDVVDLVLRLLRAGNWSIGVGAGPVSPSPHTGVRAAAGPAALGSRRALETAVRRPSRVAVRGVAAAEATDAQAVLSVLAVVVDRRSPQAWEAVDLIESGRTQAGAAAALGVSRQAVGQRLAAALWELERDLRPAAARLLVRASG